MESWNLIGGSTAKSGGSRQAVKLYQWHHHELRYDEVYNTKPSHISAINDTVMRHKAIMVSVHVPFIKSSGVILTWSSL